MPLYNLLRINIYIVYICMSLILELECLSNACIIVTCMQYACTSLHNDDLLFVVTPFHKYFVYYMHCMSLYKIKPKNLHHACCVKS